MNHLTNDFEIKIVNDNFIELWSSKRLPFEPKGWLFEMKDVLKKYLKLMKKEQGKILYANYKSLDHEFFDVENVLFYNVGSSAFTHLNLKGLVFERQFNNAPLNSSHKGKEYNHYQSYFLVNEIIESNYWKEKDILAMWSSIPSPTLKSETKPHDVWYKMKNSPVEILKKCSPIEYGIEIIINAPISSKLNITTAIKPLLDGIISVFNYHNGYEIDEVAKRLSNTLNESKEKIRKLLLDKNLSLFGSRNLIQPYRETFKWNPMDDNLLYVKVFVNYNNRFNEWTHSGKLFSLEKINIYNETAQIEDNEDGIINRHSNAKKEGITKQSINHNSFSSSIPHNNELRNLKQYEAIIEAFNVMGGVRTISEINNWVTKKYTKQWRDFSTIMADMVAVSHGGNKSSNIPDRMRVLKRVSRGKYKMID